MILLKGNLKKNKKLYELLSKHKIKPKFITNLCLFIKILKKNAIKTFSKNSKIFYENQLTLPLHTKMNLKI